MKNQLVVSSLLMVVLSGCGGGNASNDNESKTELEGAWSLGCAFDGDTLYNTDKLTFSGNSLSFISKEFNDSACITEQSEFSATGNFSIGETLILSSGSTVRKIDLKNIKYFISFSDAAAISENNSDQFCGKGNWQLNVKTEVTNCVVLGLQSNAYDIFKIDGNNLYLGDSDFGEGDTENSRPTQLEGFFYSKS